MVHCCIIGCKSHSSRREENIAFHRFPRESALKETWIKATGRQDWQPTKETRICSKHFESHCYKRTQKCTLLNYGSVPKLLVQCSEEMKLNITESMASTSEQTSAQMTPAMSGVDDGTAPEAVRVKVELESDQEEGDAGNFYVVVENDMKMELEVGPEQLQPQDIAWTVKVEHLSADPDESGLVVDDDSELKAEQPPQDAAGRAGSPGRTMKADGKPVKLSARATIIDGKLSSSKCHIYCSVFGCLTNDLENPELSFFKIPVEPERRMQWLQLILREDLMEKKTINRVCEIHFNPQDIRKSMRKTLKNNSLPCLNLPKKLKEDKETQTNVETAVSSVQTDEIAASSTSSQTERVGWVSDNETQTPASLFTPRKRKLNPELKGCRKRVKELEDDTATKSQINMLHELCDRFLTSDLAELVKAETKL